MDSRISYLLSLDAVRERASIVYDAAKRDLLTNFDFHPERLDSVADYVAGIIEINSSCPHIWNIASSKTFQRDLVLTDTISSLLMDAGSISKLVTSAESIGLFVNGCWKVSASRNPRAA